MNSKDKELSRPTDMRQKRLVVELGALRVFAGRKSLILKDWSGRMDLNHRPPGPELISSNPINALSGVAYGTGNIIFPLYVVRNLSVKIPPANFGQRRLWITSV